MRHATWTVPMEAVRAMATGDSIELLVELEMRRQARFYPLAALVLGDDNFFAEVRFEEPKYPGREQSTSIQVLVSPKENRPPPPLPASVTA